MSGDHQFDEVLADDVRAAMRTEAAPLTAPPNLLAGLRKRYARRVMARRAGVAAIPMAVAAAVGAVSVTSGAGTPSPPPSSVTPLNVAYVTDRITRVLDGVDDHVVRVTVTEAGDGKYSSPGHPAVYTNWIAADGSAIRTRVTIDGKPVADYSLGPNGGRVFVDYRSGTWRSHPPDTGDGSNRTGRLVTDVLTPKQIRQAVNSGNLTIVGSGEAINGQPTIQLQGDPEVQPVAGRIRLWVNESTYLPVRLQYQLPHGEWGSPRDLTWLPPTEQNLAQLTTPVPDDFREVDR